MRTLHVLPLLALLCSLNPAAQGPRRDQEFNPEKGLERLLRRFDKNGDNRISEDEFPGPSERFRRFDRDGNGFVDHDDLPGQEKPAPKPQAAPARNDAQAIEFFEQRIRPVLVESCYQCHSTMGDRIKGGLLVESRELLLEGGGSGPAIVPGDPQASLLLSAIRYTDEDLEMPPKTRLSATVVDDFETWINMGAPWPAAPENTSLTLGEHGVDIEAGREWWSFQIPQASEPPQVENSAWAWTDLDKFLLSAMEQRGIAPVGDAEDRTWLRRVSLDLAGLPPTPEETGAFLADRSEERHAHVVDRLLDSPRFGERWGRHWLDVARYAESSGRDSNMVYPHAWRYRDYVIEAFDADMPYDQFLVEQIAGDLLPAEDATQRAMLFIATGYLAIGSKSHNTRDPRQFAADLADEQIDTLTQGMLGVTVSCARCHDHKFDPIPTEDYYAFAGILRSSETLFGTLPAITNKHTSELRHLPAEADVTDGAAMDPVVLRFGKIQLERLGDEIDTFPEPRRRGPRGSMQAPESMDGDEREDRVRQRITRDALARVEDVFTRFDEEDGQPLAGNRLAMGMREGIASDAPLLIRGETDGVGPLVPRGIPQVLGEHVLEIPEHSSGRLELARWVASPQNPLTARVWTNRVWLHLFGAGLVSSPNNFGASGQAPSHPELLDWLAVTFMEDDEWSTKSLIRRITLSHAYRLDATDNKHNHAIDPEVTLLWRSPERRLDAEVIRDSMLAAAGTLDLERPTGSIINTLEGQPRQERLFEFLNRPTQTRSVYMSLLRDRLHGSMEVFDAADPAFVTGDRSETSVATQALYLMNNAEVLAASDALARRILRAKESTTERITLAFELALGREPNSAEKRAVKSFLKDYAKLPAPQSEPKPAPGRRRGGRRGERAREPKATLSPEVATWSAFVQTLFQCAEFRYAG